MMLIKLLPAESEKMPAMARPGRSWGTAKVTFKSLRADGDIREIKMVIPNLSGEKKHKCSNLPFPPYNLIAAPGGYGLVPRGDKFVSNQLKLLR